ncbi:MAG: thioredoxin family protein [Bacteroidetes bacterium]|nr:thioredoxin family protein [Bacteroidota bacterium]
MKHLLLILIIIGAGILTRAQSDYEVATDGPNKLLKGLISRDMLENDTSFHWFHQNQAGYTPNTQTVSVLKAKGSQVKFIVFGGTWCEDTQALLPKFYMLLDAASIGSDQVSVIMVDRHKKAIGHLPEDMHLTSTPTFIVLKGDKEVGRVIEYGKNGQWEREIGEIVSTKF